VLDYWLGFDHGDAAALRERWRLWFTADAKVDREIATRFGSLAALAAAGQLSSWADTSENRLALILLLDQFPRNLYRGQAAAFAHDDQALELARAGIASGLDRALPLLGRMFFYMPLQHAESRAVQEDSVRMFAALCDSAAPGPIASLLAEAGRYADLHADIISRFGRFPHRNRQLGRVSTSAELAYLADGGATFGQRPA
jgi:uncharacterized protein (DUF924 family)